MRKLFGLIFAAVLVLSTVSIAFADEPQVPPPGCMGTMPEKMMGEEVKADMMSPMHMMKKMMQATMVATKDGGVIVLKGNKLLKYDKNLNLVKEVNIESGHEGMYEMKGAREKKGCGRKGK